MVGLVYPDVSGRQATYEGLVLSMSPVGYWPLQETNGSVAVDLGSGGNDGTYINAPTLGSQPGPIARVAGVSRAMLTPGGKYAKATGLNDLQTLTMIAWFLIDDVDDNRTIVSLSVDGTGNQRCSMLVNGAAADVLGYWDSTNSWLRPGGEPTIGKWHFAAVVAVANGFNGVYFDGDLVISRSLGDVLPVGKVVAYIGMEDETLGEVWKGQIAHAAVFSSRLTDAQIKTLYLCGRDGQ